jgi:hypothetical protein
MRAAGPKLSGRGSVRSASVILVADAANPDLLVMGVGSCTESGGLGRKRESLSTIFKQLARKGKPEIPQSGSIGSLIDKAGLAIKRVAAGRPSFLDCQSSKILLANAQGINFIFDICRRHIVQS